MRSAASTLPPGLISAFAKEAGLIGSAVSGTAKGVTGLGRGLWGGAKMLGGGSATKRSLGGLVSQRNLRGAGVLATGAAAASAVPTIAHQMARNKKEALTPWQRQQQGGQL